MTSLLKRLFVRQKHSLRFKTANQRGELKRSDCKLNLGMLARPEVLAKTFLNCKSFLSIHINHSTRFQHSVTVKVTKYSFTFLLKIALFKTHRFYRKHTNAIHVLSYTYVVEIEIFTGEPDLVNF